ncbi:hypothetical protein CLV77_0149 [Brevirhabdus pacifica]|nr:hypothetical protein CLV77_0149 [Brevirhabdus pacifica]
MEPNALRDVWFHGIIDIVKRDSVKRMDENEEKVAVSRQIDENLKRVYQEKVEEELPDRFKNLLEQLKQQSAAK